MDLDWVSAAARRAPPPRHTRIKLAHISRIQDNLYHRADWRARTECVDLACVCAYITVYTAVLPAYTPRNPLFALVFDE